jgi:hypothetical protein
MNKAKETPKPQRRISVPDSSAGISELLKPFVDDGFLVARKRGRVTEYIQPEDRDREE